MTLPNRTSIVIVTYNVLADAYVKPDYFKHLDPKELPSAVRYPRVAERVAGFGADVICLQEVDIEMFRLVADRLRDAGYRGRWAHKDGFKPDGVATFMRQPCRVLWSRIVSLSDQSAADASGHVALITGVEKGMGRLAVVNVHLKWDQPALAGIEHAGYAQAHVLLDSLGHDRPVIVCGDLNAIPQSALLDAFRKEGFVDTHRNEEPTCCHEGHVSKIDYILLRGGLHGEIDSLPNPVPVVSVESPFPTVYEPSDHIPVTTTFCL